MRLQVSFELTDAEVEALELEAEAERLSVEEMVEWMVRQNIPPLLDVIETDKEERRKELATALVDGR